MPACRFRSTPLLAAFFMLGATLAGGFAPAKLSKEKPPSAPVPAPAEAAPAEVEIAPMPAPTEAPRVEGELAPMPMHQVPVGVAPPPAMGPRLRATLVTHALAGKQPTNCVILDGGAMLAVTNRGDNTVSLFETATMTIVRTLPQVGYSAWGVAPVGDDRLLVANWAGSTISIVDKTSGKRLGEIPVGMKPSYLALSPDGKKVFSAGNFSDDIAIADIATRRAMHQVPVGRKPMGVAVSPDGLWLYVAVCDSKKISKIDVRQETVVRTFGAPLAQTTNLVMTPDGRSLLAAGDEGRLLIIDVETGNIEKVGVGTDLSSVAVTPDGRVALAADYAAGTISLVDLLHQQKYATIAAGQGTIHVETDGKRMYACNDKSATVSAFDLEPLDSVATGTGM